MFVLCRTRKKTTISLGTVNTLVAIERRKKNQK